MGILEDLVRCKLSHEFYRTHKKLFKEDSLEYQRQCRIYVMGRYREKLEKEKNKSQKPDE